MIAAVFVAENGVYTGVPGIDSWTKKRDGRKYSGPWPGIFHPECARWGSYWYGSPSGDKRYTKGADDGQFAHSLGVCRLRGGVIEHPAFTHAYSTFGITQPDVWGGWKAAGDGIGFVCHVEQGHYGHQARKASWLYVNSKWLPTLQWGECTGLRMVENLSKKERAATPPEFMELLWGIALEATL